MPQTLCKLSGKRCCCPACGEYFSSSNSFDKHRKGLGLDRYCLPPQEAGMSISKGTNGTWWTTPMPTRALRSMGVSLISTTPESKEQQ